jgi:hypothetical protein
MRWVGIWNTRERSEACRTTKLMFEIINGRKSHRRFKQKISSRETNNFSANQENPAILGAPKFINEFKMTSQLPLY